MTTSDMNGLAPQSAGEPGTIGAGSEIYRKLDRRPRRGKWMMAAPVASDSSMKNTDV